MRNCGWCMAGREIFSVGAITTALPVSTVSPDWFTIRQSSVTRLVARSLASTVAETVNVSPLRIGLRKLNDWST